ncbi:MAG: DinB family protein, partial [Hyphomicrobiaceae bacterium]
MISPDHVRLMADYNRWQNRSIFTAASSLSDTDRKELRGAFFGSIHGTLNHLLWGDQIWMSRFAGTPKPVAAAVAQSTGSYENWVDL